MILKTLSHNISRTLALYLLGRFFGLFLTVALGLSGVLLAFDLLANADSILEFQDGIALPLLSYIVLRTAPILVLVMPVAALLSSMVLFSQLVARHEIEAARSLGVSVYRMCVILLAGGAVIAAGHFVFANTVLPTSATALRLWAENDYRGGAFERTDTANETMQWHANDADHNGALLYVDEANADGDVLSGVTLIRRDLDGLIVEIERIQRAEFLDGVWSVPEITVPPAIFARVQKGAEEMRYGVLARLVEDGLANVQQETWLYAKIVTPLGVLIMVLIAAPMAFQTPRRGDMMVAGFGIVLVGFAYFIAERLMLSLGETGALPAVLAAWSPFALAGIFGAWLLLMLEG